MIYLNCLQLDGYHEHTEALLASFDLPIRTIAMQRFSFLKSKEL